MSGQRVIKRAEEAWGKRRCCDTVRQRINKDWGDTEFAGQFSAAVVYVSFPSQVDRRYMEQLALSALIDITKTGVLDASRAALRLGVMKPEQADIVLKDDEEKQARKPPK